MASGNEKLFIKKHESKVENVNGDASYMNGHAASDSIKKKLVNGYHEGNSSEDTIPEDGIINERLV